MKKIKGFIYFLLIFCCCSNNLVCYAQKVNGTGEYRTSLDQYSDVSLQIKENGKYRITISYESTDPEINSEPLTFFIYDKNENDVGEEINVDIDDSCDDIYILEKGKYYISLKEDLYDINKANSLNVAIKIEKIKSKRIPYKKVSKMLKKYINKYTHFRKSKKKVYLIQDGVQSDASYEEDGYSMLLMAYPYIRSNQEGKNSYLTYSIEGMLYCASYESQEDLDIDCLTIGNPNKKLQFTDITVKEKVNGRLQVP